MKRESVHTVLKRLERSINLGFERVNLDISGLKTDVSTLKTDVSTLKIDVSILKIDVIGLKSNMSEMQEEFGSFKNNCYSHFDAIYNKLDFLKDEYHATTAGLRRIEDDHKIIDHKTILEKFQGLNNQN